MNWNVLVFWLMVLIASIVFVMSSVVQSRAQELDMTPSEAAIMCYVSIEVAARIAENNGNDIDRSYVKKLKNTFVKMYAKLEDKSVIVTRALAMVREEQVMRELSESPLAVLMLAGAAETCIDQAETLIETGF